jgi:hypothetical protein
MSHMWRESHIGSKDGPVSRLKYHSVLTRELVLRTKKTCARDVGPDIVNLGRRPGYKRRHFFVSSILRVRSCLW